MAEENPLLQRAYSLDGDRDKTRDVYADWAESYDKDTADVFGYVAPGLAAGELAELVSFDGVVLDAGCGTGLAGEEVHKRGLMTIDGIDLSAEMLDVAAAKSIYRNLAVADMTGPLDIADNVYDGVICVGTFTSGHVGPEAIDELLRVAKAGAPVVLTVHEKVWDKDGYLGHFRRMERQGKMRVREIKESPYHEKAGYRCQICILEAA